MYRKYLKLYEGSSPYVYITRWTFHPLESPWNEVNLVIQYFLYCGESYVISQQYTYCTLEQKWHCLFPGLVLHTHFGCLPTRVSPSKLLLNGFSSARATSLYVPLSHRPESPSSTNPSHVSLHCSGFQKYHIFEMTTIFLVLKAKPLSPSTLSRQNNTSSPGKELRALFQAVGKTERNEMRKSRHVFLPFSSSDRHLWQSYYVCIPPLRFLLHCMSNKSGLLGTVWRIMLIVPGCVWDGHSCWAMSCSAGHISIKWETSNLKQPWVWSHLTSYRIRCSGLWDK